MEELLQFNTASAGIIGSHNLGFIENTDNSIGTSLDDFITMDDINEDIEFQNNDM